MRFVAPIEAGAGARAEHLAARRARACSAPSTSPPISRTATSCPRSRRATPSCSSRASSRPPPRSWMARPGEARRPARGRARGRAGARRDRARAGAAPGRRRRALHRLLGRRPRARAGAARSARQAARARDGRQERDRRARRRGSRARGRRERALDLRQHRAALLVREPALRRARPCSRSSAERLLRVLRGVRIGPPLEDGVFMGPLVSQAAHAKLLRYRALASEAGGERLLAVDPGRPAPFAGAGLVRFALAAAGPSLPARRDLRPGGGALPDRRSRRRRSRR